MYKLVVFVPEEFKESVKNSMFENGAGKIGDYDCCSFESLGTGQFRPLEGSNAFIGSVGAVEHVAEYRVEMVCVDDALKSVITAMKEAHPYEEPAYDIIKVIDPRELLSE